MPKQWGKNICGNEFVIMTLSKQERKKLLQLICDNDITKNGEKKQSSIFGNRIAEKIATSIVHGQTFELGRTQLDPSPDMNNYTFKKKRYPFWTVCVYGRVCFKCLMTYDVTIISAMSYPEIKLFFSAILIMSLPKVQPFFS